APPAEPARRPRRPRRGARPGRAHRLLRRLLGRRWRRRGGPAGRRRPAGGHRGHLRAVHLPRPGERGAHRLRRRGGRGRGRGAGRGGRVLRDHLRRDLRRARGRALRRGGQPGLDHRGAPGHLRLLRPVHGLHRGRGDPRGRRVGRLPGRRRRQDLRAVDDEQLGRGGHQQRCHGRGGRGLHPGRGPARAGPGRHHDQRRPRGAELPGDHGQHQREDRRHHRGGDPAGPRLPQGLGPGRRRRRRPGDPAHRGPAGGDLAAVLRRGRLRL
ncbi:MAG: L-cystine ABC transporter, substrate-binding protein TcyA, partial [uncultured Quadrisphaera sp.]